jgi:hypothetical protein
MSAIGSSHASTAAEIVVGEIDVAELGCGAEGVPYADRVVGDARRLDAGEGGEGAGLELRSDRPSAAMQLAAVALSRDAPHARAVRLDDEIQRWVGQDLLLEERAVLEVPADDPEAADEALKRDAGRAAVELEGAALLPRTDQPVGVARRPRQHGRILPRRPSRPSVAWRQ